MYNKFDHFCILFGNVDWLKTGHMTFYKKLYCTDVTNYSNTHAIYDFFSLKSFKFVLIQNFKSFKKFHKISMF
jgi:hypothetical protein